jgi:hypothetical protein
MYVNGKWYLLKLFQAWGEVKENEGVNSSRIYLIYFKNFCKGHSVSYPAQQQQQEYYFKIAIREIPVCLLP